MTTVFLLSEVCLVLLLLLILHNPKALGLWQVDNLYLV